MDEPYYTWIVVVTDRKKECAGDWAVEVMKPLENATLPATDTYRILQNDVEVIFRKFKIEDIEEDLCGEQLLETFNKEEVDFISAYYVDVSEDGAQTECWEMGHDWEFTQKNSIPDYIQNLLSTDHKTLGVMHSNSELERATDKLN